LTQKQNTSTTGGNSHGVDCMVVGCTIGELDTILCDKVCQWLATCQWFSLGTTVSSTNKTDHHDITEILLKLVLNTITVTLTHPLVRYVHILFAI
jgi:hypothetical protein